MHNPELRKMVRQVLLQRHALSTGSVLLDRTFTLPIGGLTLLYGEHYAGCTAIALEITAGLTKLGRTVVFVDIGESLFPRRLHGIDTDLVVVLKPTRAEDLLDLARALRPVQNKTWIIDSSSLTKELEFASGLRLKDAEELSRKIRRADPSTSIVCASRTRRPIGEWDQCVEVRLLKKDYVDRDPIGHTAVIHGPKGVATVYIEYHTGRLLAAYESAILQLESGTPPSGVFHHHHLSARGLFKFIEKSRDALS